MTTSAPDRTHTHSLTTGEQHAGISWPLALWLPLVVYFAHYILRVVLSDAAWERWVLGELGATEMLTLVVLLLALAAGIAIVRETVRRNESPSRSSSASSAWGACTSPAKKQAGVSTCSAGARHRAGPY